ncbi:hypothetical protein QZH41_002714 [Actinostola sp. cb2023]|nr:hypothetical protein QZH41_002714 [Actinostola sp. cb2023]
MKNVNCVIIGTDNADKKELLVGISTNLSPKRSRSKENLTEVATESQEVDEVATDLVNFRVIQEEDSDESDDEKEEEIPNSWEGEISVESKSYNITVNHCPSMDSYMESRKLLYLDADIFLVCFSVSLPLSLEEVVEKWVPELRSVCPVTPFILVGTHTEWREIYDHTLADVTMRPVFPETGAIYGERVGAVRYMECSADGTDSVRFIFNEAVRISTMDRMELSQLHPDYVRYGSTLLHQAVQFNHEASVETLAYVMDINVRDKAGRSPLDIAVRQNYVESARCLIRNGCEVEIDNEDWRKRCEFWIDEDAKQHVVNRNILPLARQLMNWYASLQDPFRDGIMSLSNDISKLKNLKRLRLSRNKLKIGCLRDLQVLDNRLEFPPHEILKQGADEVLKYLNTFLDNPVQNTQVKVTLVGGEGAGKSTLVTALRYKKPTFPEVTDKTIGIDISDFELNQSLRMKYTMSKASASAMNHLGRLQLWLEMIYSQAPSSHVIIVATNAGHSSLTDDLRNHIREDVEEMISIYQQEHKKQFEGESVPQCSLCEGTHLCVISSTRFYINQNRAYGQVNPSLKPKPCIPHIVGYYEMIALLNSCVGYLIPQKCLYVRDRILEILNSDQELQDMPIFTLEMLREIALGCGMRDEFKIKMMLKYFHNQGEFLWFEDIPELCDTVIVRPQWLMDRLRALYSTSEGNQCIIDGIFRTRNLSKLWPEYEQSEQATLLSLVRGLGLSFHFSSDEDIFPSLLPHGYPDEDSWPRLPSPTDHQVTVEFAFSFLPPSFFGNLMVSVTKRELICVELGEPTYYRYNLVFTTNLKACQGCVIHNRETSSNPLEDIVSTDQRHTIHIESLPHERAIRATVRGPAPCCVLPEVRVAIKLVSDVHYQGIRFTELMVCPACALTTCTTKLHYITTIQDDNNVCPVGHPVGGKVDLLTGRITEGCQLPYIRKRSARSAAIENGQNFLEDRYCPKLFVVLPIQFKPQPFKGCRVMDHVVDGYAVHFLCECPGYWHLVPFPGYRVRNLDEFFGEFGARVCKLMKLIFLLDDTITYPSLKNLLLKVVIGDPAQREVMIDNIKALVDHYCSIYPNLMQECSSFLYEDVGYLVSGKGLSRSRLARILEIDQSNVSIVRLLGAGGFGSVYEATYMNTRVALKKLHTNTKNKKAAIQSFKAETRHEVMELMDHPYIVRTLAISRASSVDDNPCFIMEYVGSQTLQHLLHDQDEKFDDFRRIKLANQVAKALVHIHQNGIVHLDLKPANILMTWDGNCKVADFGCSQFIEDHPNTPSRSYVTGTFAYRAPELLKGEDPTYKADVFSFGICLWQFWSREIPYKLQNHQVVIFRVVACNLRPTIPAGLDNRYADLMTSAWDGKANNRPTMEDIVNTLSNWTDKQEKLI